MFVARRRDDRHAGDDHARRTRIRPGRRTGRRSRSPRAQQVYVTSADGNGTPAPLENGGGHSPAWSPDGTKIAFDGINPQEHDPFVDLHVVNARRRRHAGHHADQLHAVDVRRLVARRDEDRLPVDDRKRRPHPRRAWRRQPGHRARRRRSGERLRPDLVAGGHARRVPGRTATTRRRRQRDLRRSHRRVGRLPRARHDRRARTTTPSGGRIHRAARSCRSSRRPDPRLGRPPRSSVPGPVQKPTIVWITKRIPWTPGRPDGPGRLRMRRPRLLGQLRRDGQGRLAGVEAPPRRRGEEEEAQGRSSSGAATWRCRPTAPGR